MNLTGFWKPVKPPRKANFSITTMEIAIKETEKL